MPVQEPLGYEVAKPFDAEEVVRLLAAVFSQSEPPAVAMDLPSAIWNNFFNFLRPELLQTDLRLSRGAGTRESWPAFSLPMISLPLLRWS